MAGRRALVLAAALGLAAVGAGAFVVLGGDDGDDEDGVVLLAADDVRDAPFYDDLGPTPADGGDPPGDGAAAQPAEGGGADVEAEAFEPLDEPVALAGLGVRGTAELLYAAPRDELLCERAQAVRYLASPDDAEAEARADAWFEAIGRHVDNRNSWAQDLTAVLLRRDTRVVAHDLVDGAAVPFPAVLQAGTAVLVDRFGVPRLRCADGLPLAEPGPGGGPDAGVPDGAWDGFDPAEVVVVQVGSEIDTLVVVDPATGVPFERRIGSNGESDRDLPGEDEAPGRCDDCPELDVTLTLSEGTEASLVRTKGAEENRVTPGALHWSPGQAEPGPYAVRVQASAYVHHTLDDPEEYAGAALFDDPELQGEDYHVLDTPGQPGVWDLWVCVPGEATLTIALDEVVVDTVSHALTCGPDDVWTHEFTVP